MAEIHVTQKNGRKHVILLDDADFEKLGRYKWHVEAGSRNVEAGSNQIFYAVRAVRNEAGVWTISRMHREISGPKPGFDVDHINHNGLDNRSDNLRNVLKRDNQGNQRARRGGTSKYKGVYWDKGRAAWRARLGLSPRKAHLGYFDIEEDAARAYNVAAIAYFGDCACPNELPSEAL